MIEKKKIFGKLDNRLFFTTKFVKAGNRQAKSTHRSIMFVGCIGLKHGKKNQMEILSLYRFRVLLKSKTRNETMTIFRWFSLLFC